MAPMKRRLALHLLGAALVCMSACDDTERRTVESVNKAVYEFQVGTRCRRSITSSRR